VIVVDTNIVAALCLRSAASDAAAATLERDREWQVPRLWRSEFRNVLATLMRVGALDLPTSLRAWESAVSVVGDREYEPTGLEVLRLAEESGCTAYDCEFVAVARDLGVPLVTQDRRLLEAFPEIAISLGTFAGS
jgi:predicted nucleic acid-binding protein